jgi:hypothetical protein
MLNPRDRFLKENQSMRPGISRLQGIGKVVVFTVAPVTLPLLLFFTLVGCAQPGKFREISMDALRDKIKGGWAGQMIGVSFGEPTEFAFLEKIIAKEKLPEWRSEMIRSSLDQDDLYVEMTFAEVLDDKGLDATTEDFGAVFKNAGYRLWHANLGARRALRRGVAAGDSGSPQYNAHANDIDFQIESDFIGLMSPGLPVASNDLAWRAGRVMNSGDGVYGGMFVSCMYGAAFFEEDVRKVVETGLACIPRESPYARTIADVLQWSLEHPDDWQEVWRLVEEKWNDREPCPAGALNPFNIDAKLNGAYIALGLLYGGKDFDRTLEIATRSGQDSDCNPSNAAGILGVMLGYEGIPSDWRSGIPPLADEKFSFTRYSFNGIVESTERRAIALVERHGGRLEGDRLLIPVQDPVPARLEIWDDYGSPVERIGTEDPRWTWKEGWVSREVKTWRGPKMMRTSGAKGAEAAIRFDGTGAIVVGPYLPDGGMLDVYLDDRLHRTVDVYSDSKELRSVESIWHAFGLAAGEHDLLLVVRGEPYGESQGQRITVQDLIVFR